MDGREDGVRTGVPRASPHQALWIVDGDLNPGLQNLPSLMVPLPVSICNRLSIHGWKNSQGLSLASFLFLSMEKRADSI